MFRIGLKYALINFKNLYYNRPVSTFVTENLDNSGFETEIVDMRI
jgi:hypothetical protein